MKTLIVEDNFIARRILMQILSPLGDCDIAKDGEEALMAFQQSINEGASYDLICMDIMMPNMDGHEALKRIRAIEREHGLSERQGVKVIMTSAKEDPRDVVEAMYQGGATLYLVKPVVKQKLLEELRGLGLIA